MKKEIIFLLSVIFFILLFTKVKDEKMVLRATFPRMVDFNKLDPVNIRLDYEYTILEHIYSPLIEIGENGDLIPGIAEKFEWIGNDAYLTIRDDLLLPNGRKLNAEDVEFSLKRQIILDSNFHGKFTSFLCSKKLVSINEKCDRIVVVGNQIILKFTQKLPFLFRMLTSLDYAIIPVEAIDINTLKIKNYKISSGPYLLDVVSQDRIILNANETHYNFNELMPSRVEYLITNKKSTDLLKNNELEIITTDDYSVEVHDLISFASINNYNLHQTYKIKSNILVFTDKGNNFLSLERRMKIGKLIRNAFEKELSGNPATEKSYQFFPDLSDCGLNQSSLDKVIQTYDAIDDSNEDGDGVTLVVSPQRKGYFDKVLLPFLPKLNIVGNSYFPSPFDLTGNSGDMFMVHTDTGFQEQIGLLSYSVSFGFFGQNEEEGRLWLDKYMLTEDKKERYSRLNDLHLKSLLSARIVPIYNTSYVAVSSVDWEMNFSPFYSNSQLWRMRKK